MPLKVNVKKFSRSKQIQEEPEIIQEEQQIH